MNVLTDEEIDAVAEAHPYNISLYTRAIEAAVIRKLAAGVSVEPDGWRTQEYIGAPSQQEPYYNADQLSTALAAARVQMNEECAELVAHRMDINEPWMTPDDVRALLGKEQS